MSVLPLRGAEPAFASARSCVYVTLGVMDWDSPVEFDRPSRGKPGSLANPESAPN